MSQQTILNEGALEPKKRSRVEVLPTTRGQLIFASFPGSDRGQVGWVNYMIGKCWSWSMSSRLVLQDFADNVGKRWKGRQTVKTVAGIWARHGCVFKLVFIHLQMSKKPWILWVLKESNQGFLIWATFTIQLSKHAATLQHTPYQPRSPSSSLLIPSAGLTMRGIISLGFHKMKPDFRAGIICPIRKMSLVPRQQWRLSRACVQQRVWSEHSLLMMRLSVPGLKIWRWWLLC